MGKSKHPPIVVGKTYDKLTVKKFDGKYPVSPGQRNRKWWRCDCACGTKNHIVQEDRLRKDVVSCGCNDVERKTKHGGVGTPEYDAWTNMIQRMTNPNSQHWASYGGKGICVCERWRGGFSNFLSDVGKRPSSKHSLDRPNVERGYHCGKCTQCKRKRWKRNGEWATNAQQARNTTRNNIIRWKGKSQCATDWALEYHMPPSVVLARLNRKWKLSRALKTPVGKSTRD